MRRELSREQLKDLLRYAGVTKIIDRGKTNIQFCCPVHGENTPSMGIRVEDTVCHCFSCHWSGNIQWLLFTTCKDQFRSIYEVEAWIRDKYQVDLGAEEREMRKNLRRYEDFGMNDDEETEEKQHELPMYYLAPFKSGKETYAVYFERGFNKQDMVNFKIGRDLENETFTIPVFNADSTLCGVVGRYIDPNRPKNARYMVYEFPKGKVTYPIDKLQIIDDTLILVEGILDAQWLHKYGYTNAQAILGNGLSYSQAELLKKYKFSKVILAFDDDTGGETAIKIAKKRLGDGYKYLLVKYPEGCKDVQDMTEKQLNKMFSECTGKRKLRRI